MGPPDDECPGMVAEALKSRLAATDSHSSARPENSPTTRRRYWARRMIDKAHGAGIPTYGSPEWACLPEDDARWVAAVVIAAESWARAGDTLEDDLRREVADLRAAYLADEDEDYRRRAAEHRARWGGTPSQSFSSRRAEQLRAAEPRPSDRPARGGKAS
jgi:hypothetical protein